MATLSGKKGLIVGIANEHSVVCLDGATLQTG